MKLMIALMFILMPVNSMAHKPTKKERLEQKLKEAEEKLKEACYKIKFYNNKLCGHDECDEPLPKECR